MSFIGDFFKRNAMLNRWLRTQNEYAVRVSANPLNLDKAYWTPPLTPMAAFRVESLQIERELGLRSLVSISDHDTIGAPMALRVLPETRHVPISVEWTVPFGDAVFHMGIHNLPAFAAESMMENFREYTKSPRRERLTELLEWLDAQRDVLVVLNHPYWDLAHIGSDLHEKALHALLAEEGECIHALELSGIRSWEENQSVRRLAEGFNQMLISGGDRHGSEPNATLNLSSCTSFDEFVNEIRRDRQSHVLFMPQYRESNTLRVLHTLRAVTREYSEFPVGSQRWDERVFHCDRSGEMQPIAHLWSKPPIYIKAFFALLALLDVGPVDQTLRVALRQPDRFSAPLEGGEGAGR
ncbi:PHP domain-containing protein [Bryocella elongata]|uniref:PHP domain-containing protein n=1 Tax=Bryocella elongata TaxID=863522 RepID=UPI000CDEC414|nr:hypothetical protein [Bryocella elongata]